MSSNQDPLEKFLAYFDFFSFVKGKKAFSLLAPYVQRLHFLFIVILRFREPQVLAKIPERSAPASRPPFLCMKYSLAVQNVGCGIIVR